MNPLPNLVAVVDDDVSVRSALRRVLVLAGYEVETFADGADFLASLPRARPSRVVMDVHMPGLSGFEVVNRMRASGLNAPVVFMTGSADDSMGPKVGAAGTASLLLKPFSADALIAAL